MQLRVLMQCSVAHW